MSERLNTKQRNALALIKSRGTASCIAGQTQADQYTAWVHYQTAKALERRGLIEIDRSEGWDIELVSQEAEVGVE